jgi:serine/threonine protein phosphatase PrpC
MKARMPELIRLAAQPEYLNMMSEAGSTATVLLVTDEHLYCANAGDARTVLSKAGSAVEMSLDHKP